MSPSIDFDSFLVTNAEFLKPFASTLTRDYDTAQDLYQETIYRALTNSEKYSVGTNVKAWLYTIMRNIFINNYRRRVKQKTVFDHTPDGFLLDSNTEAINVAEAALKLKDINYAINVLPEIFREPFLLYFDGFKYNEISDMLHEPLGTIKSRIHFARKLLRAQIDRI